MKTIEQQCADLKRQNEARRLKNNIDAFRFRVRNFGENWNAAIEQHESRLTELQAA